MRLKLSNSCVSIIHLSVCDGASSWPCGSAALACLLGNPVQVKSTVQVLPNWSFSAALAARMQEGDGDSGESHRLIYCL